jgi:hypothetical protein
MSEVEQPDDANVFINYRRTDVGWPADHLSDKLKTAFGKDRVFLDVRSIEAGDDFTEEIKSHLERATVLIVLVDKQWLCVHDKFCRRRLDSRDDWVRREIRTAIARKSCKVIPVLLDDAQLPDETEALPRDIAPLLSLQRISISLATREDDIDRLLDEIEMSGFKRLAGSPSQGGSSSPLPGQAGANRLRTSKTKAAQRLKYLIKIGELLLDHLHKSPPSSPEQLEVGSRDWHCWRRQSEQSMWELFSSSEPLQRLRELRPRHLDFDKRWEERASYLPQDIEKETQYLRNLLQRLDTYQSIEPLP